MQCEYRIEVVIQGKRRGIVVSELARIVRPLWDGIDYYMPAAVAVWEALEAVPGVEMVSPKPGVIPCNATRQEFIKNGPSGE